MLTDVMKANDMHLQKCMTYKGSISHLFLLRTQLTFSFCAPCDDYCRQSQPKFTRTIAMVTTKYRRCIVAEI